MQHVMSSLVFNASDQAVKSVTVFKSSKAEVVRTFSLLLRKGQNKIEIKGLSSSIDTQSVRVSGFGNARLFDVVCTLQNTVNTHDIPDLGTTSSESIRALTVKKKALQREKDIREQEAELLLKYAQTLSGEHVTPAQMSQFLESYVTQGRKTVEAITVLNEKINEIDRLVAVEKDKASQKKGSANGRVNIVLFSDEDGSDTIDLKLTYIVSNAQWKPTYELHASTESGKPSPSVSLFYRARITQETGEDWNNTSLTLSTMASDIMDKEIPRLKTRRILPRTTQNFPRQGQSQPLQQHKQMLQEMVANRTSMVPAPNSSLRRGAPPQPPPPPPPRRSAPMAQQQQQSAFSSLVPWQNPESWSASSESNIIEGEYEDVGSDLDYPSSITENKTIVSETPVAVSFLVHGESTIPSDGIEHRVSVAELPFSAHISYITIPRIDPRVFLQCKVTNSSEYRLLPGPVTVIFDDSYVSKTSINRDISTGDSFECTLGDDASTKVTYTRSSKTVKSDAGSFSEITNTTTCKTKISVYNKHQFPINDLIIRECVPTSDDKRARVILRKPEGLAEAKDGDTVDLKNQGLSVIWSPIVDGKGGYKDGQFEWKWKVNAGAKVIVEAEWDMKSTGDIEWVEGF